MKKTTLSVVCIATLSACMYGMAPDQPAVQDLKNAVELVNDANESLMLSPDQANLFGIVKTALEDVAANDNQVPIGFVPIDAVRDLLVIQDAVAKLARRPDGGYITYQVQQAINQVVYQKSAAAIATLIKAQAYLGFNPPSYDVANALVRTLVFKLRGKSLVQPQPGLYTELREFGRKLTEPDKVTIIKQAQALEIPAAYQAYVDKHATLGDTPELSIADYIALQGLPDPTTFGFFDPKYGYNLAGKGLTSLAGIEQLPPDNTRAIVEDLIDPNQQFLLGMFGFILTPDQRTLVNDYIQKVALMSDVQRAKDALLIVHRLSKLGLPVDRHIKAVRVIDLSGNSILDASRDPAFPNTPFSHFYQLEQIRLNNNLLRSLAPRMFAIPNLQTKELYIDLNLNGLYLLPVAAFEGLPENMELKLGVLHNASLFMSRIYPMPVDPITTFVKAMAERNIKVTIEDL